MTVVSLARQGGAGALNTIYAEDGTIFLAQAEQKSTLDALTTAYAGYLHTAPRVIAELVTLLPASRAAAGIAVAAALVTALMAWLVYVASGSVFTGMLPRVLVAAVVVLVPVAQEELPNSIANLQWFGLYALFWVLLWAPATTGKRIVAIAATLMIALSCVISVALLPLALWQVYRKRDRLNVLLLGAMSVGLVGQILARVFSDGEQRAMAMDVVHWAPWWVIRAVPSGVVGQRWLGTEVDGRWLAIAALAWVIVAGLLVLAWRCGLVVLARHQPRQPQLQFAATAILCSIALYAAPTIISGIATPRYAAAPAMLVIAALVAILAPNPGAGWRTPLTALAALCVLVWATNLVVPNARGEGPTWDTELSEQPCIAGVQQIPITPEGAEWIVTLPCS
jgi:hypothetical protein